MSASIEAIYDAGRVEVFVSGRPATFATAGEKPWKECLRNQMPSPSLGGRETGVLLDFSLPTLAPAGNPLDLDNLCEPVFSVIANQVGWFGKRRPNIQWWQATRRVNAETGCHITISETPLIDLPARQPDVNAVYSGDLPISARDRPVADWASRLGVPCLGKGREMSLHLAFGRENLNIGDISTGRVKNFIDCLYPILGGCCGDPDDDCISMLAVQKGHSGLARHEVSLRAWCV